MSKEQRKKLQRYERQCITVLGRFSDLPKNHKENMCLISMVYQVPLNELINHVIKKKRGLGSALMAAKFVSTARADSLGISTLPDGYQSNITLAQGYELWKMCEQKLTEDINALNPLEQEVLKDTRLINDFVEHKFLRPIKMGYAPEAEAGEYIPSQGGLMSWTKLMNYFNKEYDDDEDIIHRRDPFHTVKPLDGVDWGNLYRGLDYLACDLDVRQTLSTRQVSTNIPEHYAKEITGGGQIITPKKKH